MKAENLAKLIIEKCTTKKGEIKKKYLEMLFHLCHFPTERRRTFQWHNKGRSCRDTQANDLELLTLLGIDYTTDNDAPKGGQNGNYIVITIKGYNRALPFIRAYKKEVKRLAEKKMYRSVTMTDIITNIMKGA
jgi:hypothetical protein